MHKAKLTRRANNQIGINIHGKNGEIVLSGEGYKRAGGIKKMMETLADAIKAGEFEIDETVPPPFRFATGKTCAAKLRELSEGLLFISESDRPFTALNLKRAKRLHMTPIAIEEILKNLPEQTDGISWFPETTKEFFHRIYLQDGEKDVEKRFHKLERFINKHLTNPVVFRIGSVNVNIYIVGLAPDGSIVGLKTVAIQT